MSALKVVIVAEIENYINQGKRYLQAWKTIWPFLRSYWGRGVCVRAACVLARVSCLQLNFLCIWASSPMVEAGPWALQVRPLPPSLWLLPRCLLDHAWWRRWQPWETNNDRMVAEECPVVYFSKSKAVFFTPYIFTKMLHALLLIYFSITS